MPAEAFGDDEFVVNFLISADGAVGERGRVGARAATVDVVAGAFEQVLIVELRADVPQGQVDRKYYAPGVGLVFEDSDVAETDVAQLVGFAVTN